MAFLKRYLFNWLFLFDQACNTLIGGDPRETMSARMGRDVAAGKCCFCGWVCAALGLLDPGHCAKAAGVEKVAFVPELQIAKE